MAEVSPESRDESPEPEQGRESTGESPQAERGDEAQHGTGAGDSTASSTTRYSRQPTLEEQIAAKEARKLKARREKQQTIWFGLGMFGLIGWSVSIPALVGVAIGLWIDSTWPSNYSWSLMLLIVGVIVGCLNAWNWIQREGRPD